MSLKKTIVFIIIASILFSFALLFATPLAKKELDSEIEKTDENTYLVLLEKGSKPEIVDQLNIGLKASNIKGSDYQYTSAVLKAGELIYDLKVTIDGCSHTYFIYPGIDDNYTDISSISEFILILPGLEGIEYEIRNMTLSKRIFYPLDIKLAKLFIKIFKLDDISQLLVSFYILIATLISIAGLHYLLFKNTKRTSSILITGLIVLSLVFSAYFFTRSVFITKSYYDSYSDEIRSGDIDKIYEGFSGFERFIKWLGENIPSSTEIVVFVRGKQIYLESEMAYNLYPKDISFIDISGNAKTQVVSELGKAASEGRYLILLTEDDKSYMEDIIKESNIKAIYLKSYKEDAGFIYSLSY